jgi:hypothetical protein
MIDGNKLTPTQHARICGARDTGASIGRISKLFQIPKSTVQITLERESGRVNSESLPRSGRPISYSEHHKRVVLRFYQINPKATFDVVRRDIPTTLSRKTIYRILKESGRTNWLTKKSPYLTKVLAKLQLKLALEHKD